MQVERSHKLAIYNAMDYCGVCEYLRHILESLLVDSEAAQYKLVCFLQTGWTVEREEGVCGDAG